jgi:type IV secretory pathway TraG/TraD family ATPase VirD4
LSIAEPETAKYFSQSIGDTEILESSESMSMGPSSVREGLTFSRNSRIRPLVMYSTFQDFKDMTGILKLCNYDYCHVDIPYISYEARQKYLIIRDEMKLETILLKLNESKSIVESVIDTTETKAKNNDEQITKDEHAACDNSGDDAEYNQSAKTPTVPDPDENLPGNDVHDHDLLD